MTIEVSLDIINNTKLKYSLFNKEHLTALWTSLLVNYIFYISCILCLLGLSYASNTPFIKLFITFIFISWFGYVAHIMSHLDCVHDMVKCIKKHFNIGQGPSTGWIDYIATHTLWFYQFHEDIHHNLEVNKKWNNILIESAGNFWFQAGTILALKYILQYMDTSVIVIWGMAYVTVHNINYILFPSTTHVKHHLNKNNNYGIDLWDIMFGTKYQDDITDIENINHYAINLILCTVCVSLWLLWKRLYGLNLQKKVIL